MKKILSLGVRNPVVRVVVWLGGCASLSLAGAAAGALGAVLVAVLLVGAAVGRVNGA